MFVTLVRNERRERHAAFSRTLALLWVHASEGEDILIETWDVAA